MDTKVTPTTPKFNALSLCDGPMLQVSPETEEKLRALVAQQRREWLDQFSNRGEVESNGPGLWGTAGMD